jgi:cobalamin biosynthesis Mg chelatase CobN
MARFVTLTLVMMMVAAARAQEAECDNEALAQATTQMQTDCAGESACSDECLAAINGMLNTAEIEACFTAMGETGTQVVAQLEQIVTSCASGPGPVVISEGSSSGDSSSGDSSSGDSSSGSGSTPDEATCDAEAFSDVLAGVEADCDEEKKCSSGCQAHVNTILGNEDIQVCFGDEDSRAQMMAGFQQVKAQCGSASAVSVAAVAVVAAAALLL